MIRNMDLVKYRYEIVFCGILILSAFLNLWNIWAQGISNEYYAAAVKSMIQNPGLIFFNSFDPAGFVTIDKPPVGLWVQVASAALLGFSGWSLVLPQALAGVGSVALIYWIVFPRFGKPAGLVSSFALAVTPIFVAVSRNGTMDMQLIFVLLLATLVALKAAKDQSLLYLLLSVIVIGVGFNIKMIQAFIIVPAVLIIYLLGAGKISLPKKALHAGIAVIVLLSVSLCWAVAVDMVPADERPYIGGSGDNTVLGLIINYNGIHRLENGMNMQGSGPAVIPPGSSGIPVRPDQGTMVPGYGIPGGRNGSYPVSPPGVYGPPAPPGLQPLPPGGNSPVPVARPGGGIGMLGGQNLQDTGIPGILRLLSEGLAGQISWLIPFSLIGLLAWWRWPLNNLMPGCPDRGLSSEKGLALTFMVLWLLPGLAYFSFTTGFWHPYYLATIAPPLAALVGIGAVMMYREYRTGTWKGWLLVAAVLITGLIQVLILSGYSEWAGIFVPALLTGIVAVTVLLFLLKFRGVTPKGTVPKIIAVIAIALLFVTPFIWACTPLVYNNGGILPSAGPQLSRGGMQPGGNNAPGPGNIPLPGNVPAQGPMPGSGVGGSSLVTYLTSHTTGETWYVAVPGSHEATSLIIDYGIPVMSIGGFSGTDRILTVDNLKTLMNEGKIRYFLIPSTERDNGAARGDSELYSFVRNQSTVIPATEWGGGAGNSQYTLYDLGTYS